MSILLEPEILPQADGVNKDEVLHRYCCKDHRYTFCGLIFADGALEAVPEWEGAPTCVVCEKREHGTDECPLFGRCVNPNFRPIGN